MLSRFKIGPRLAIAFGFMLLASLLIGTVALLRLSTLNDDLQLIEQDRLPKVIKIGEISEKVWTISRDMRDVLLAANEQNQQQKLAEIDKTRDAIRQVFEQVRPNAIGEKGKQLLAELDAAREAFAPPQTRSADKQNSQRKLAEIDAASNAIQQVLEQLRPIITSERGKQLLAEVDAARSTYLPLQTRFVESIKANQPDEATKLLNEQIDAAQTQYIASLDQLVSFQEELVKETALHGKHSYRSAFWIVLAVFAVAAGAGAVLAWAITRSITTPLDETVHFVEAVAQGDLTRQMPTHGRDEIANLATAVIAMNESLKQVVGSVRQGSESVVTASSQIAQGNRDLSARTEQQASSLQETAASMEQMTSTVRASADAAKQANQLAAAASGAAARGGEVVGQVVATMADIESSSKKIADIISVIDGIAFQTNILALNAAVEAARAGEQGRGFAVVASEVRSLAQRSAQAAREIKSLIAASVAKVEAGGAQVTLAGSTMNEIVTQVQRVTDLMGEITSATQEQASGLNQVNQAVSSLDQTTQQNAALVEQSSAAAESLRDQANKLADAVAVFKIAA